MVYKSYLIQVNNINIVEQCGLLSPMCKKKDFTCGFFLLFLVFGISEDRLFSHDMAHIISLFPCPNINISLNKVS